MGSALIQSVDGNKDALQALQRSQVIDVREMDDIDIEDTNL